MVSTTAKVTIRGGLPVRKQVLFLTTQLYKIGSSSSAFWSAQGSRSIAVIQQFHIGVPVRPRTPTVTQDVTAARAVQRGTSESSLC